MQPLSEVRVESAGCSAGGSTGCSLNNEHERKHGGLELVLELAVGHVRNS